MEMYGLNVSGSVWALFVGSCEDGNEPSGCIKARSFLTSFATVSFWRKPLLHGVSYRSREQYV